MTQNGGETYQNVHYHKYDPGLDGPDLKMPKGPIYVTGNPRSGNTWLNRLLSDALASPAQTVPGNVLEWFGPRRDGQYVIRKRHLTGAEADQMADGPVVFIQRDPRDLAVSKMYYRSAAPTDENLMGTLRSMIERKPPPNTTGRWYEGIGIFEAWVRSWTDRPELATCMTTYERLHELGAQELARIIRALIDVDITAAKAEAVFDRQGFGRWSMQYPHSMRKGKVGD